MMCTSTVIFEPNKINHFARINNNNNKGISINDRTATVKFYQVQLYGDKINPYFVTCILT
jgi:hypothetical protein